MAICYGCLQDKKLKNSYCTKCIKETFDGILPSKLEFDKKEFYTKRVEYAPRMSISGVQDKLSLKYENNKLVVTDTNGKYILKPIPSSIDGVKNHNDTVANEHLSMKISNDIFKINTAKCALIEFSDGELAYITKRFDYIDDELKYDQEDFASVLDVNSQKDGDDYKYSAKSYEDCAKAIKDIVPSYIVDLEDFFKRILLNYLISNGDAHLKNFSIFSSPNSDDYRLTPNYDILNTRYHINETMGDMAMDFMNSYTDAEEKIGYYTYEDFYTFAKILQINEKRFEKIYTLINNSQEKVKKLVDNSFLSNEAKEYYYTSYLDRLKRVNYRL